MQQSVTTCKLNYIGACHSKILLMRKINRSTIMQLKLEKNMQITFKRSSFRNIFRSSRPTLVRSNNDYLLKEKIDKEYFISKNTLVQVLVSVPQENKQSKPAASMSFYNNYTYQYVHYVHLIQIYCIFWQDIKICIFNSMTSKLTNSFY